MKITIKQLKNLIRETVKETVFATSNPYNDLDLSGWHGRSDHPYFSYTPRPEERPNAIVVGPEMPQLSSSDKETIKKLNDDAKEFIEYMSSILKIAANLQKMGSDLNLNGLFKMAEATRTFGGKFFGANLELGELGSLDVSLGKTQLAKLKEDYSNFVSTAGKFIRFAKTISTDLSMDLQNADPVMKQLIKKYQNSVNNISELYNDQKTEFENWKNKNNIK